ncbi:hypothetical protein N183_35025 [Sinorhizobium sp. Sb3]|nr:hypothetical protein N183_35025 [Sinorhizobium sp. Sb3]
MLSMPTAHRNTAYNAQRLHSALDYLAPEEFEQKAVRWAINGKVGIAQHGAVRDLSSGACRFTDTFRRSAS